MAASGAAMAESAVTMYGLIDESILINTNQGGGRTVRLSDNGTRGNRLGLIGTENLGNGNSAIFRLDLMQQRDQWAKVPGFSGARLM